jgi:FG-GAP repeat protein
MPRLPLSFVALATTSFISFAVPISGRALAQEVLLDVPSPVPGADADVGVAIGDWDGDGIADLAIGAPRDSTAASEAGAVRIHSGKDGSVLAALYGVNADDYFGAVIVRMPDLDGDGVDDMAVSSIYADNAGTDTGSVYLYSGRTGAFQRRIDGPATDKVFGYPIGSLGDVDGDGIGDLFVGNFGGNDLLHVHSGADGHEITTLQGPKSGEYFGVDASAIDDLDGDGVRELLVGAKWHTDPKGNPIGAAYVVSPVTGTILRTHEGTFFAEYLGYGTAALEDLDGDGVNDYAVSTRNDPQLYASMVVVFSGATGAQLGQITTPNPGLEALTQQIDNAGDVNGDGIGDILVGGGWSDVNGFGHGAAFLFSGKNLLELDRIDTAGIGVDVAPFGDANGDGKDDLLVGMWDLSFNGEVILYSGDDLWLNATPSEALAGQGVEFNTREGLPGTLTVLALEAIDGVPTFQLLGGVRSFGALGGNKQFAKVPGGLAGHQFTLRAYANDVSGKVIRSATQALSCK